MPTRASAVEPSPLPAMRLALLWALVLGSAGTLAELLLIGHYDSSAQWIPLVLLTMAVLLGGVTLAAPARATLRLLQLLMVLMLAGGVLGVGLHYNGNEEFELEISPSLSGVALASEALTGATPVLAPGSMSLLGVIGLVFTYRHPLLRAPLDAASLEEVQS